MENKVLKKIIIFMTVFMLVFSNCGYTLQALAATDGISLFGFSLFKRENLEFDTYFLDENGKKQTDNIQDVNSEMTMVLELTPKTEGYLKRGTIKAVSEEEGDINFKFEDVSVETVSSAEKSADLVVSEPANKTLLKSELAVDSEKENEEETQNKLKQNTLLDESKGSEEFSNSVSEGNTVSDNTVNIQNTVTNETVSDQNLVSEENVVENTQVEDSSEEEITEQTEETEELVDEETALTEEAEKQEVISAELAKASVVSENEIEIENIIESTKVYVNISFKTGEKLNVEDLYKKINLELEGTYINTDLEELPVTLSDKLEIGWEYSKDIDVSSEFTKVSPFKIGDTKGTIVEDTITVKRDVTEDNYLPIKETEISINVPNINGNIPTELNVKAIKLKATKGEDVNEVTFSDENWEYNANKNTIDILVKNEEGQFTYGEDIYVVTLRYDTYVADPEISLENKGTVKVTEFSGKNNNEIVKNLDNTQKILANVGELITYSISTTEEKIEKSKINANYNNSEEKYEAEFGTTASVNILTNDVLNEFILKDTKEFYIDKDGLEFETNDVKYKNIKFKYEEIKELLEKDGIIEIKNNNGELLYTLNKDLIKSDNDTEIAIEGDVRGIEIAFKNIRANGNINIEFIKAIGKSSYEKAAFTNFDKLESKISAVVKYSVDSVETTLEEVKTEKEFEESKTKAEITMNKVCLSTTEINKNVEFKIELNNDKEDTDLYVNPTFEITLPKYVTNIDIKGVNILYAAGLSIGNTTIYRAEDGTQRMRVEVNGTQTEFSKGTITNGTNIILNANIELDRYAPRKDEQVKLYYINEGVTNYDSQTKWTIEKDVPTGILKTTNGFDSYVFKINAPLGFVTANEMQNYDGQNSIVSSIKQGTEIREIEMGKTAQVARMNLIAINNTENKCTDVAFLGRIPVKGVTDVKTGEKLETNIDATMISRITENEANPLSAKIYYSSNPNANTNLNDSSNGWKEEFSGINDIKSFLIVPDKTVEPGYIFRYSYEYVIPENLPYEAKIYGSFGAVYNNHADMAITYETTSADLVGVVTKSGPKVEATLSVDVGNGTEVREAGFLDYTLTVVNSGSEIATGVNIEAPVPEGTTLYEERMEEDIFRYGFYENKEQTQMVWNIDEIKPGEVEEFKYTVKVDNDSEKLIKNKAKIKVTNLSLDVESNEITNRVKDGNLDIDVYSGNLSEITVSENYVFVVNAKNISGSDLTNMVLKYELPKELTFQQYESYKSSGEEVSSDYNYDSNNNTFSLNIAELEKDDSMRVVIYAQVNSSNTDTISSKVDFIKEDQTKESSRILKIGLKGPKLEASQISANNDTVTEGDNVEFIVSISNNGNYTAEGVEVSSKISENLKDIRAEVEENSSGSFKITDDQELKIMVNSVPNDEIVNVHVYGTVKNVKDNSQTISSKMTVSNRYVGAITTNEIVLNILDDPTKSDEEISEKPTEQDEEIENTSDNEENKGENESSNEEKAQNNRQEQVISNGNDIDNNQENNQENSNSKNNTTTEDNSNKKENNNNKENNANNNSKSSTPKYSISGKIWLDSNRNGVLEDGETGISGVQIQLQKDDVNIKATASPKDGVYSFKDLEAGTYVVTYNYDEKAYTPTVYKNIESGTERASYARGLNEGQAITDTITIGNANVDNINLGLQEKEEFDLTISKNITLAKVITNGKTTEHKYKNLDLAKLEISAKDLKNTKIELHYQIVLKNTGNVPGRVMQVADFLPRDTELNSEGNKNWYLGSDGNIYNDSLNNTIIAAGETRTLDLVLIRNMNEENTGVLSNKVAITKTEGNTDSIVENTKNNDATQEIIISVRTGYTAPIVFNVLIIGCLITIIYLEKTQKIKFDIKNFKIKRIYK